jgi:Transposase DDE domain
LSLEAVQDAGLKSFHQRTCAKVVSADTLMEHARGPVWHRKQQVQGIIPKGLHGVETEGTWSYSKRGGWVYGHGTFCLVACRTRRLGAFKGMRNSGNEAKRMWLGTGELKGLITTVRMDSKAADPAWCREFQRQRQRRLRTTPGKGADNSLARHQRVKGLNQRKNKRLYKQRSSTVEPLPGVLKDSFEGGRCRMRGHANNRWLFAAMGVTVQRPQSRAWQEGRSPWAIQAEVLGC